MMLETVAIVFSGIQFPLLICIPNAIGTTNPQTTEHTGSEMEEKYHHHRTIFGGAGVLGLAQALSGIKTDLDSDDETYLENKNDGKQKPASILAGTQSVSRRKSRSSVRFKQEMVDDQDASEGQSSEDEHQRPPPSLSRKSSVSSIHVLPEAPK
ncbi:UNVERIFIED_CONTAM: hypothetical protein HDU68_007930, partial [Siphonaria sp. JEL0065]